jgi:hypothetical protein
MMDEIAIGNIEIEILRREELVAELKQEIAAEFAEIAKLHKRLEPVYTERWQEKTGSTLKIGDKLLITPEFQAYKRDMSIPGIELDLRTHWALGKEYHVDKINYDGGRIIIKSGGGSSTGVDDYRIVERMRDTYLAANTIKS